MTVTTHRYDIRERPDDGRPKVLAIVTKRGSVTVHVSREDGSLWLFATGPVGGERGRLCIPARRAPSVLGWIEDGLVGGLHSSGPHGSWIELSGLALKVARITTRHNRSELNLDLDSDAKDELLGCLSAWAGATKQAAEEATHELEAGS